MLTELVVGSRVGGTVEPGPCGESVVTSIETSVFVGAPVIVSVVEEVVGCS